MLRALIAALIALAHAHVSAAATSATLDVEEARVERARTAMPEVFTRIAALAPTQLTASEPAVRIRAGHEQGAVLWRDARNRLQRNGAAPDDRPLYWRRLATLRDARATCAANSPTRDCGDALQRFELASRGITDVIYRAGSDLRVLVTGFDPFLLDRDIAQSNPSGIAALALDDRVLDVNGRQVEFQTMVVPVRFADFDAGLVEHEIAPLVARHDVDLLVTISMGRDDFDLERFPGRRRSATAPGNRNVVTGASADNPLIPGLDGAPLAGPEFVEFSLPVAALLTAADPYPIHDNRTVTTLERGTFEAASLQELADQTAVRGGGGGYLSNEISYRTVHALQRLGSSTPVGHIHTPRIVGYDAAALATILAQIERMLTAAAGSLFEHDPEDPMSAAGRPAATAQP